MSTAPPIDVIRLVRDPWKTCQDFSRAMPRSMGAWASVRLKGGRPALGAGFEGNAIHPETRAPGQGVRQHKSLLVSAMLCAIGREILQVL